MERGNTKHGPRQDEQLAHEIEGMVRGGRPSWVEPWRNPEPPADDEPELFGIDRIADGDGSRG